MFIFRGNLKCWSGTSAEPGRCVAVVYRRDTYRRTGRGKSRFELAHTTCQCKRKPGPDGLCRQHRESPYHVQGLAARPAGA